MSQPLSYADYILQTMPKQKRDLMIADVRQYSYIREGLDEIFTLLSQGEYADFRKYTLLQELKYNILR